LKRALETLQGFKQKATEEILKKYSRDLFGFPPDLRKDGKVIKKGRQSDLSLLTKLMK